MADSPDPRSGKYLSLGLEMAVGVGLGVLVGWWLDKKFGWSPWGVVSGATVGVAAGMYMLIKDALKMNK